MCVTEVGDRDVVLPVDRHEVLCPVRAVRAQSLVTLPLAGRLNPPKTPAPSAVRAVLLPATCPLAMPLCPLSRLAKLLRLLSCTSKCALHLRDACRRLARLC